MSDTSVPPHLAEYTLDLERAVLKSIAANLKTKRISLEQSKHVARALLDALKKTKTVAELHAMLPALELELGAVGAAIEPLLERLNQAVVSGLTETVAKLAEENKVGALHKLLVTAHGGQDG